MIDNCANYGIPAQIIYLYYFSTTIKLVSEKTLLDGTTINNFASWQFLSLLVKLSLDS